MAPSEQITDMEPCNSSFEETSPDLISTASDVPAISERTEPEVEISSEDDNVKIENTLCKISFPEFPVDRPWLPPKALAIIAKIKKGSISEADATALMKLVAYQAIDHFQLQSGKFVALTFSGRVVEIAETRVGLLKKIQGQAFEQELFVWRVGSDSFSGRL